jgi:hypothetical protein
MDPTSPQQSHWTMLATQQIAGEIEPAKHTQTGASNADGGVSVVVHEMNLNTGAPQAP